MIACPICHKADLSIEQKACPQCNSDLTCFAELRKLEQNQLKSKGPQMEAPSSFEAPDAQAVQQLSQEILRRAVDYVCQNTLGNASQDSSSVRKAESARHAKQEKYPDEHPEKYPEKHAKYYEEEPQPLPKPKPELREQRLQEPQPAAPSLPNAASFASQAPSRLEATGISKRKSSQFFALLSIFLGNFALFSLACICFWIWNLHRDLERQMLQLTMRFTHFEQQQANHWERLLDQLDRASQTGGRLKPSIFSQVLENSPAPVAQEKPGQQDQIKLQGQQLKQAIELLIKSQENSNVSDVSKTQTRFKAHPEFKRV